MSMFDKLASGFKKKAETQHTDSLEVFKKKLKGLVYDDELVEDLAPIFAKLSSQEGFDKVVDLLESKERQLEYVSGGEWNSEDEEDAEVDISMNEDKQTETKTQTAEEILAAKFS